VQINEEFFSSLNAAYDKVRRGRGGRQKLKILQRIEESKKVIHGTF